MKEEPLAARMRPRTLSGLVGQDHLTAPGGPLDLIVNHDTPISLILWAPPGSGKTSIAHVIKSSTKKNFVELSATTATVKDVRAVVAKAKESDTQTIVFLDEIHRFTKSQQDILLPHVEDGTISLIGATTENPSFSVNSALNSRCVLLVLKTLTDEDIKKIIHLALTMPRGLNKAFTVEEGLITRLAQLSSSDARQALNRLEVMTHLALAQNSDHLTHELLESVTGTALQRYDQKGDQHYDVISAFIKSMRGSDPDATLYWLARMLEAGEDPRFIARRIVIHASEDVGMADPTVLPLAVAAAQAVQLIGLPEARINLAHAAVAVATAAKSPAIIKGINEAESLVKQEGNREVPMHLRDAHYPGAKALGHGAGYLYPHDYPHGVVGQQYCPGSEVELYHPTSHGYEKMIKERLASIDKIVRERS